MKPRKRKIEYPPAPKRSSRGPAKPRRKMPISEPRRARRTGT